MPSEMDSQKKSLPAIAKINNWTTMIAEAPYNQLKQIIFRKPSLILFLINNAMHGSGINNNNTLVQSAPIANDK